MADKIYEIIKEIPLVGGGTIATGSNIYEIHEIFYMDGGMLPKSYQDDFRQLIEYESTHGWEHIVPLKQKTAFK